jgi:hypothetical protein
MSAASFLSSGRTLRFRNLTQADIFSNETIIIASDATEERGQLPIWDDISRNSPTRIITLTRSSRDKIEAKGAQGNQSIDLKDEVSIKNLLNQERYLVDISGMPPQVWAPIIKALYSNKVQTRVLYAEPASYKLHSSPASSALFDLSVRFEGLSPLPGFAKLSGPENEDKCIFVALLGFEGDRPERLVLQIDPIPRVIPIVGVPGFQIEFPAYTVSCNRDFLSSYRANSEIRYAHASSPFEVIKVLSEIRRDYADHYIYLAPVGTKPHALGTIIFAAANENISEVMFDHPIRKSGRTDGIGVIHIYDFNDFSEF